MDAPTGGAPQAGAEALGLALLPAPALAAILDCLPPSGWAALASTCRGLAVALRDDHVGGWRARCGAPAAAVALVGPRAPVPASSLSSSSSRALASAAAAAGRAAAPATTAPPAPAPAPGHIGKRTALSLARVAEWGAALRHTGEVNTLVALKLHELPPPPPSGEQGGEDHRHATVEEEETSVALPLPPSVAVRMPHLSAAERGVVERLEAAMGGLLGSDGDVSDAGGGGGGGGRRGNTRAPAGPVDDPVAGLARTFRTLLPSATPGWRTAPGPVQADAAEGHLLTILSTGVSQRQRGAPPPMAAVAAAEALADELAAAVAGADFDDRDLLAPAAESAAAAAAAAATTSRQLPHGRRTAAKRWLQAVPESSPYRVAVAPLTLVPPTHHHGCAQPLHGGGGGSGGGAAAAASFLGSQVGVRTAFGTVRGGAPIPSSLGGLTTPVQHVSVDGGGRVAAVDGGGTLRVHAHDGTRLAAGKVAGVCSGSGGGGAGVGRCCASVCSLDYHAPSSAVVTGHPDGSAVVTVFSGGQAVRAATALRFDDALLAAAVGATGLGGGSSGGGGAPGPHLPSRRALASQGMRGHTTACWMDHGTQLLVGRSLRAGPLLPVQCGTLSLHSPETGELVRLLQPPAASSSSSGGRAALDAAAYGDGTGLGSCPTAVKAVSPTTALVGYANGLLRLWDVRSPKPAITARLAGDPRRALAPSVLLGPVPDGRVRPFHLPGDTRAVGDAGAPIQHLACDATASGSGGGSASGGSGLPLVYEARKGGAFGGGDGRFDWAASSPFIRAWDLRSSPSTPVHVVDLGPHSLRRVAGLHADGSRLLVAHTHVWCPSSAAASAGAAAAAAGADWRPPQFHWNAADRGRGGGGGGGGGGAGGDDGAASPQPPADPAAATDSLPHHLAESDLYTGLVPQYAWPSVGGAAPPAIAGGGGDDGAGGAPGALFWRGSTRGGGSGRPRSPPAPTDVYGEPVAVAAAAAADAAASGNDDTSDAGSDDDGDEGSSHRRFAPLVPVAGSEMSGLSVWHPGTLSLCAYVPLASAGCLAADGVTVAVGTDAGVLTWATTAAATVGTGAAAGGGSGQRSAPGTPSASPLLGGLAGGSPSSPKAGGRAGELLDAPGGSGGGGGTGRHWLRQRPGDKQYRDMNARQKKGGSSGNSGDGGGDAGAGAGGAAATAVGDEGSGSGARRHGRRVHHNHLQRHHRTAPTGGAAASSSYGKPRPRYDPRDEAQTDAAREAAAAAAAAAAAGGHGSAARRVSTASTGSRRSRSSGVSDASGSDDSDDWSTDDDVDGGGGGGGREDGAAGEGGGSGRGASAGRRPRASSGASSSGYDHEH